MDLKYSESAIEDLYEILDFIALDSPKRASSFIDKLKSKIELLTIFPNLGVSCRNKGIAEDCRIMIFESYLVFYAIEDETVVIRNIINCAFDYTKEGKS